MEMVQGGLVHAMWFSIKTEGCAIMSGRLRGGCPPYT